MSVFAVRAGLQRGIVLATLWLASLPSAAAALPPYQPDAATSQADSPHSQDEADILSQARNGQPSTFDCTPFGAAAHCAHSIPGRFLERLLTAKEQTDQVRRQILVIKGVQIEGDLDLANLQLLKGLELDDCVITGRVDFSLSNATSNLFLKRCHVLGKLMATDMISAGSLVLDGTVIEGDAQLGRAHIGGSLQLNAAHVAGGLDLAGAAVDGDLDMSGSNDLACAVQASQLRVKGNLWLGGTKLGETRNCTAGSGNPPGTLDLTEASVGGELALSGATLGSFAANRLHVSGLAKLDVVFRTALILRGAVFDLDVEFGNARLAAAAPDPAQGVFAQNLTVKDNMQFTDASPGRLNIAGGRIGGNVNLSEVDRLETLNAANATVGGNFSLSRNVTGELNLNGAHVGGNLYVTPAMANDCDDSGSGGCAARLLRFPHVFQGLVLAYNMRIDGSAYFSRGDFEQPVMLGESKVGQDVWLKGAVMNNRLDMGGVDVHGIIHEWPEFGNPRTIYSLRDATAGSISDSSDSGRGVKRCEQDLPKLDLQGFTYAHLGASNEQGGGMMTRDPGWFVCAFNRDSTFTMQPYRQAAGVFRAGGDDARANAIMRAANLRQLQTSWSSGRYFQFLQTAILGVLIGWGLGWGYGLACAWVIFFTALGAVLIHRNAIFPEGVGRQWVWSGLASLTHFIPFLTLDKECDDFLGKNLKKQSWLIRGYFAFHAGAGYLIGTCIAAGLAGLTQAS